ncbi:unnamed protein product [Calypogeia fissa]
MPGQALLKATLLKETYVPLVDLNGAEQSHGVVRVLPRHLSLMERRFLDQIAPTVFPVREQFKLRQAARLQKAGFQVKDVIKVYEGLIAAGAKPSKGYTTLETVNEDFEFSQVELQRMVSMPEGHTDHDTDLDRLAKPFPMSSPDETLTSYRNAIFENVMLQLEEKWREAANWDDTEHASELQIEEKNKTEAAEPTGGTDGGSSEEEGVFCRNRSSEEAASDGDQDPSPKFLATDSTLNGSLELSFEVPLARRKPEESDVSAVMNAASWRCYIGCVSKSPSSTDLSSGGTATPTPSMPSVPTTGAETIGMRPDAKMVESVKAAVIQPMDTVVDGRNANLSTEQSGEPVNTGVNRESLDERISPLQSFSPHESGNSLRKLLNGGLDAPSSPNGTLFDHRFFSPRNSIDEEDEVEGERSLMSILRRTREVSPVVGHDVQSNLGNHNYRDGRDLQSTNVEKSRLGHGARIECRRASPLRQVSPLNGWSELPENLSTKFNGDGHGGSMEGFSKTFGKSQSMKESPMRLSEAKQSDISSRRVGVPNRIQSSPARSQGGSPLRSPGRPSPTFLRSLSMQNASNVVPEAKQDLSSRRVGIPNRIQSSLAISQGVSPLRSPGRSSPTFLRSLSMQNASSVVPEAKQDLSSRMVAGVPNGIQPNSPIRNFHNRSSQGNSPHRQIGRASPTFLRSMNESNAFDGRKKEFASRNLAGVLESSPVPDSSSEKCRGGSHHRSFGRLSIFFGKNQSIKERTVLAAAMEDLDSARSPADGHGSIERPVKLTLASKTIEKIQGMLGRRQSRTRFQPVIDSTGRETRSQRTQYTQQETHAEKSPNIVHDNNNNVNVSTLKQVLHGNDGLVAVKRSAQCSRQKLGSLIDHARDVESDDDNDALTTCTSCTIDVGSLKRILGYRTGMFRIKTVSAWLSSVDWISNTTKLGACKRIGEVIPPKRSVPKKGITFKRKSRGRSPRSSTKRTMMSPKRKADRAKGIRKLVKPGGSTADEFRPSRSPNRSPGRSPGRSPIRSVSNEGQLSAETSTNKIHPIAWTFPGGVSSAVNVDGSTDMNSSAGRNQPEMEQLYPTLGHRPLRSRSTSSRFRREYIARQEMVHSQTVVAGG